MKLAKIDETFVERKKKNTTYTMVQAHFHNVHELYFLERGSTKYFIGNELFLLSPGDIVFVPKGEFHRTDNMESSVTERILFQFDDAFIGQEYQPYIEELKKRKHLHVSQEHLSKLRYVFQKLESENQLKEEGFEEMEKLYLRQLLILLCRYHQTESPRKNFSETYRLISDAARHISANCNEELTLEGLAKKYALSPYYFSKLFKEVMGIGLSQYINVARITLALQLLSETKLSVTEIAAKCGFNDSGYFIQTFKKLVGVTPKRYSLEFKK